MTFGVKLFMASWAGTITAEKQLLRSRTAWLLDQHGILSLYEKKHQLLQMKLVDSIMTYYLHLLTGRQLLNPPAIQDGVELLRLLVRTLFLFLKLAVALFVV